MDITKFLAMKTAMDIVSMVEDAVEHIVVVKHALAKIGIPEDIISNLIQELAELNEEKYSNMTLQELKESIGRR